MDDALPEFMQKAIEAGKLTESDPKKIATRRTSLHALDLAIRLSERGHPLACQYHPDWRVWRLHLADWRGVNEAEYLNREAELDCLLWKHWQHFARVRKGLSKRDFLLVQLADAARFLPPIGGQELRPASKPRKVGRKPAKESGHEQKIREAWETGAYESHAELDTALHLQEGETARVLARLRKRENRRTKSKI